MTNKQSRAKHPHSFGSSFFGTISYVGITIIWLLVLTCIIFLTSLNDVVVQTSDTVTVALGSNSAPASDAQTVIADYPAAKFGVGILLVLIVWIFAYFGAKFSSRVLRHFITLFGRTISYESIALMKYLVSASGLIGIIILLQFFPAGLVGSKLSIAFLGFIAGLAAVSATWVQKILLERHKIPLKDAL